MKISSIVIQTRNLSTGFTRDTMLLSLSASVLLLSCSLELVGSGLKSDNSVDIFSQGGNISDGNDNCVRDSADIALYLDLVNEIESVPDLNGGFTKSLLLKSGSAALDFGLTVHCRDHDARGVKRILDADGDGAAFCDAGPIEHRPEDLN